MENILGAIDRGLALTGTIVGGVRAECRVVPADLLRDWDVRAVTNHVVGGFTLLAGTLTTGRLDGDFDGDWFRSDPNDFLSGCGAGGINRVAQSQGAAGSGHHDLRNRAGTIGRGHPPHRVVVDGSDIAVATGAEHLIDEELCAELLTTMHRVGIDNFRVPGIFGPEVPVNPQVPPHLQLMAYLGRTVLPTSSLLATNS